MKFSSDKEKQIFARLKEGDVNFRPAYQKAALEAQTNVDRKAFLQGTVDGVRYMFIIRPDDEDHVIHLIAEQALFVRE